MQQENIHAIIERAKQQRAEYIGSAIKKHPIATLAVVGIPVLLTQVPWNQLTAIAEIASTVGAALIG
jgi:hypothetical protein